MTSQLEHEFQTVYRKPIGSYPTRINPTYSVHERLRGKSPYEIIESEPVSLALLLGLEQYGKAMMRVRNTETQQIGKVLFALAVATENERITDILNESHSTEEMKMAQTVIKGNVKLKKYLKVVRRQHRDWLPEDAREILDRIESGSARLYEVYGAMFIAFC